MRFLSILFFLLPSLSFADAVKLEGVPISQVAKVVYGEILKLDYVVSAELLEHERPVTVMLQRDRSPAEMESSIDSLWSSLGVHVVKQQGVRIVGAKRERDEIDHEEVIYRPHFRSVGYLTQILSGFFGRSGFSQLRDIPNPASSRRDVHSSDRSSQIAADQAASNSMLEGPYSSASKIDKREMDVFFYRGTPENCARIRRLLPELDVKDEEVLIRAAVFEVQKSDTDTSALDLAANVLGGRIGFTSAGGAAGQGARVALGGFSAVLNALTTDRRFKVLSRPSVRIKNGSNARITVGADVPILSSLNYQGNGQSVQSVSYKSSGVILDLTPSIRREQIELQVFQQLSDFIPTTTGVNATPTMTKRELTTTTLAKGGDDVIMLGGLVQQKNTDQKSGFSFLPDWLHSTSSSTEETELFLVLHVEKL